MILRADRKKITDMSRTQSIKTKSSDPIWRKGFGNNTKLYGGYYRDALNNIKSHKHDILKIGYFVSIKVNWGNSCLSKFNKKYTKSINHSTVISRFCILTD